MTPKAILESAILRAYDAGELTTVEYDQAISALSVLLRLQSRKRDEDSRVRIKQG